MALTRPALTRPAQLLAGILAMALAAAACGSDGEDDGASQIISERAVTGLWVIEPGDSFLELEIDTAVAIVRSNCGLALGSYTFVDGRQAGAASFTLPGGSESPCSSAQREATAELVEQMEQVERWELALGEPLSASPSRLVLLTPAGDEIRLTRATN